MAMSEKIVWSEADMIAASIEWWGDEDIDPADCRVYRDEDGGYCYVVHLPTGRTTEEAGDAGRWNLDGTARD